jgi:hypothetical protein
MLGKREKYFSPKDWGRKQGENETREATDSLLGLVVTTPLLASSIGYLG